MNCYLILEVRERDSNRSMLEFYDAEMKRAQSIITARDNEKGKKMVARDGIEPPTQGFSVLCSTN